jgi:hypothetical protein
MLLSESGATKTYRIQSTARQILGWCNWTKWLGYFVIGGGFDGGLLLAQSLEERGLVNRNSRHLIENCCCVYAVFLESKSGMRVNHRPFLQRLEGHNQCLGKTETPASDHASDRQTLLPNSLQSRAISPNTTTLLCPPLSSIRQAYTRNPCCSSCRPCNQVRSTARRFLRHVYWPPSL